MLATGTLAIRFNGATVDAVPATSRGLHYGDGVFRTMLQIGGQVLDLEAQLARLARDAAALGLLPPSTTALRHDLASLGRLIDCSLKLLLLRAGSDRGYRPQRDATDCLLLAYPLPVWPASNSSSGIAAIRSPIMLAAQPRLAGIKHLNRLEQVLASRDWPASVDEAIMTDDSGAPVCGTRSNLFWVADGKLHTPAVTRCGVAGVTRDTLLTLAAQLGIETRVSTQPWAVLLDADEAFICNSLIGLWPLKMLDQQRYDAPGPITARLQRALAHPLLPSP